MKHVKTSVAIIVMMTLAAILTAVYSDEFVLGAYSELRSHYEGTSDFNLELAHLLKEARFNSVRGTAVYNPDQQKVVGMANSLDADSLDLILDDHIFIPHVQYGYSALSTGVYKRFEAEYCSQDSVNSGDENDDEFFYQSVGRLGARNPNYQYSNLNCWHIPANSTGWAYKDLLYRWPNNHGDYYRIGPEFSFLRSVAFSGNPIDVDDNCLYVKFVFKATEIGNLADDDTLSTFSFTSYTGDPTAVDDEDYPNILYVPDINEPEFTSVWFYYGSSTTPVISKSLTKAEYDTLPSAGNIYDPSIKYITFTFPLELPEMPGSPYPDRSLKGQEIVKATSWYWQLKNLNPRMWWHGNGEIMLDYVEFYDKVFEEYTDDPNELARLRDFALVSNLTNQYGIDEPKPPHYQAFKKLEDHLEANNGVELISASSFEKKDVAKPNGTPYRLTKAYIEEVQPRALVIDRYPFVSENVFWNGDPGEYGFVQTKIDAVLDEYELYRNLASTDSMRLFMVPQIYGEWNAEEGKWNYLLPPGKMAKCLQMLPLCYKPDGIISFKFDTSNANQYAMVKHGSNSVDFEISPIFSDVMEANRKIRIYGPMIRKSNWEWKEARTIGLTNDYFSSPNSLVDYLVVEDPGDMGGFYGGYVQAALYLEDQYYPSFMLVNRRVVKVRDNDGVVNDVPPDVYHQAYAVVALQPVKFCVNSNAQGLYGDHLALYDPFDKSIYRARDLQIEVPIGPGDGRLMQMCCTLPQIVTGNQSMNHLAALHDEISLYDGAQVSISAGTDTHVLANTSIHIPEGCSFTFRGTVDFGDNASICVEPGGNLSFEDAVCTWGKDSIIEVENATLSATGCSWYTEADTTIWCGIRASASSDITLNDVVISNANYNSVSNSNLEVTNCRFNVPADGFGLLISNTTEGFSTRITNNESGQGFFGNTYQNSRGIVLGSTKDPVILDSVYFNNLMTGIWKNSNVSVRDSITGCTFSNCNTGINIISSDYAGLIESCNFNQTVQDSTAAGIRLIAANPRISECDFTTHRGILTEYCIDTFSRDSGVFDCDFDACDTGIESRGSNHRLERNYFNYPDYGIVCHAKSNLNLQNTANNVLISQESNIKFFDEQPYEAWIQLFKGHNDFYHLDQGDGTPAIDFEFDPQYFGYPLSLNNKINASRNWFQDMLVTVNDPLYTGYVYVDSYDPDPNMPAPPPENDRFFTALGLESQGQYGQALELYKAILNSPLEPELRHLASAADGVYRLTELANDPTWDPTVYFDAKALQYETEDPSLSGLLEEYLAKSFIVKGDYQSAIDLIQLRLDYPTSEVDSLLAVLDLEIVLQLAALEEDKKPLTTKYTQYRYPDVQTFKTNHELHWNQLRNLKYDDPDAIPVPSVPVISGNYPNPFNPSTTIEFSVPQKARVKLNVYNIRGQKVKILINGELDRGYHKIVWDGRDGTNRNVSSGIYFIRLESDGKTNIRKVMLMK